MQCGIVGLPQAGKTTLFNLMIKAGHGSGESGRDHEGKAHLGLLDIPDHRLDRLKELYGSEKATPARVEFIDTPAFPLEKSAAGHSRGQLLADVREVDAIVHVVGLHQMAYIPDGGPSAAYRFLADEFILSDLEVIEKRLERLEREIKSGRKEGQREMELLRGFKDSLDAGSGLNALELDQEALLLTRGYSFLSLKPELVVLNAADTSEELAQIEERLRHETEDRKTDIMVVYGLMELEICDLDPSERSDFLADLDLKKLGSERLLRRVLTLLNMIRFYTANEREVRAWAVPEGTSALDAAGKVHQDMQRGFIRAEVVRFDDLQTLGGWSEAKNSGKLRLEGKEYLVEDGDVIYYRFKV